MTDTPSFPEPMFPANVEVLAEIGEEFGCDRQPGESDMDYGMRINACLDDMIEELHAMQDRVLELMS